MAVVFTRSPWGSQIHECDEFKKALAKNRVYPHLVTEISFDLNEKSPILTNGADHSCVTFCPFCGINLKETE